MSEPTEESTLEDVYMRLCSLAGGIGVTMHAVKPEFYGEELRQAHSELMQIIEMIEAKQEFDSKAIFICDPPSPQQSGDT